MRYPPRLEFLLEKLMRMGAPALFYRPNDPDADGVFERAPKAGVLPPAGVATRKVAFDGMRESSIYWPGEARRIRRRGGSPITGAPAFDWVAPH